VKEINIDVTGVLVIVERKDSREVSTIVAGFQLIIAACIGECRTVKAV
jgi:glucose uptake protein GlcU